MPNLQEGCRYAYPNLPAHLLKKKTFPLFENLLALISDIVQDFSPSFVLPCHSSVFWVWCFFSYLPLLSWSSAFLLRLYFDFLSPTEQPFSPLSPVSCFSVPTSRKALSHPPTSGLVQEQVPKRWKVAICIQQWLRAVSEEQDCKKPQRRTPQEQALISKLEFYAPVVSSPTLWQLALHA